MTSNASEPAFNVIGSTDDDAKYYGCTSFIDLVSGKTCANKECSKLAKVGAHVLFVSHPRTIRCAPFCHKCNSENSENRGQLMVQLNRTVPLKAIDKYKKISRVIHKNLRSRTREEHSKAFGL